MLRATVLSYSKLKWLYFANLSSIEKVPLFYHFHSETFFEKKKKKIKNDIEIFGGMIKLSYRSLGIIFCNNTFNRQFSG